MSDKKPHERHLQLKSFDQEELLEAVPGAQFEHFLLNPSSVDAHVDQWSLDDFNVVVGRYSFPVRAMGPFPVNKHCLGFMRHSRKDTWVNGYYVNERTMEFYPHGCELNYRAAPDGEWVAVEFDEPLFHEVAQERLGHAVELEWTKVISFEPPPELRMELDLMIRLLWSHPLSGNRMVRPIMANVASILHGLQTSAPGYTHRKWHHFHEPLQRADAYLKANLGQPFDLATLAANAGASPRSLQRHFTKAYGVTPKQWARCLALHRVRERLLEPGSQQFTIAGLAREYGFRHMGRFATNYQNLFGELPSDTSNRSRQRPE